MFTSSGSTGGCGGNTLFGDINVGDIKVGDADSVLNQLFSSASQKAAELF